VAAFAVFAEFSSKYNDVSTIQLLKEKKTDNEKQKASYHDDVLEVLSADKIREYLKYLTSMPSTAGLKEAKIQAKWFAKKWKEFDFDTVEINDYNVLLSLPKKPGKITMYDEEGDLVKGFEIDREPLLNGDPKDPRTVLPFNAYSPAGTVEGPLVYVNYGREEDYQLLEDLGISVSGAIVIMRYSKVSRSSKVERAQLRGALGTILYSDPVDWSPFEAFYPKGWELPSTGLQIGTILRHQGDVLSEGYPSKDGYFRMNVSKTSVLPKIPSQPIPFKYAKQILGEMDGIAAPSEWQGAFDFKYNINGTRRVRLSVYTKLVTKPVYNVCGKIHGETEPDRLIILGNHRDSWNFGAADATSGSAALMEIARSFSDLLKRGWRPRRTIMLCSWDAEEFGLMGSWEWVEDHAKMVNQRVIAYLNVDIAVEGNHTVRFKSTPQMEDAFFEVTKTLPAPDSKLSLYDDWTRKLPSITNEGEPMTQVVQTGSDYKPFIQMYGIPCLDIRYLYDKLKMTADQYSAYHSIHDNFHLIETWVDPKFKYHLAVARMWAKIGLKLADDVILPFNLHRYAKKILEFAKYFKKTNAEITDPHNIDYDPLITKCKELVTATKKFHNRLSKLDVSDEMKVRIYNDQLMNFERVFIHESGHHGTKNVRHMILGTTAFYIMPNEHFPALKEAIYRAYRGIDPDWDGVNVYLSILMSKIDEAKRHVEDVTEV